MNYEVVTTIAIFTTVLIGFIVILIMFSQQNREFNQKFDLLDKKLDNIYFDLSTKNEKVNTDLTTKVDNANIKLSSVYHELIKRNH